jgi:predicted HicB family RNase H-like nuclease
MKRMMMNERPELEKLFGVRLDERLHKALKVEAAKRGTTMSAIIRKALRKYTDINENMEE